MAGFQDMATGLFIIVLCINLGLAGFGGIPLPSNFGTFVPNTDQNLVATSFTNPDYVVDTNPYSVPSQTQLTNENDPFASTVNFIVNNGYSLILTSLFGITLFALKLGLPSGFILALIGPINVMFLFYLAETVASLLGLRGSRS